MSAQTRQRRRCSPPIVSVQEVLRDGGAIATQRRRGGGPGQAAVKRAPLVQVVVVVADAVGFPVGRPGVDRHDEVAVDEAAVALGYVAGVLPGLVVQVIHVLFPGGHLGERDAAVIREVAAIAAVTGSVHAGNVGAGAGAVAFQVARVGAVGEFPGVAAQVLGRHTDCSLRGNTVLPWLYHRPAHRSKARSRSATGKRRKMSAGPPWLRMPCLTIKHC